MCAPKKRDVKIHLTRHWAGLEKTYQLPASQRTDIFLLLQVERKHQIKSRQLDLREEPHELLHGCRASAITACQGEYTQLATLTILPLSLLGHKGDRWANTSYLPFALLSSACRWCLTVGNHLPSTLEEEFRASLQAQYLPLFAPHFLFPKLAPESFLCINSRHCVNTVLRFTSTRLFQLQLSSQIDFLSHKFKTCTV